MEQKTDLKALLFILLIPIVLVIAYFLIYNFKILEIKLGKNKEETKETEQKEIPKDDRIALDDFKFKDITESTEKRDYKVLIIDIDPVLTKGTIENRNCSGINASTCLNQNKEQVINELIKDLNDSSHNSINIVVEKTESINEFATFKKPVKLLNGQEAYRFDEDTWLDIFKKGWYNGINDPRVQGIGDWFGTYDYEYIIDKLNLIERRKNKEFDEVWIVNVDPALTYESIMVGKNAFWINGTPIEKDCEPFKMINVSIARPDTNLECFGHATEQLLNEVYKNTYYHKYNPLNWNSNSTTIEQNDYARLNFFQKFMLTEEENTVKDSGLVGVGNMHFSPNSTKDYEWNNTEKQVNSKYDEWLDYPNLKTARSTTIFSPSIYMNKAEDLAGTISEARLHHRWWFSLIPHHTGVTKEGYSNNWWDYYISNKHVVELTPEKEEYTLKENEPLKDIRIKLVYSDNSEIKAELSKYERNIEIKDKDLFYVDETGQLYAKTKGSTQIKYYIDGNYTEIKIKIE